MHRLDYETTFNSFVDNQLARGQLPPITLGNESPGHTQHIYTQHIDTYTYISFASTPNFCLNRFSFCFCQVYEWEALQEDDLAAGVLVMFTLTLLVTAAMMVYVTFFAGRSSGTSFLPGSKIGAATTTAVGRGTKSSGGDFISTNSSRKRS